MKGFAVILAVIVVLMCAIINAPSPRKFICRKFAVGHVTEAQDSPCLPLRCMVHCPMGYQRDSNNCMTCDCLSEQEAKAKLIPLLAGKMGFKG